MDSLTQATLGAAVGEAVLGKKIGYKASIIGAIGGTLPDLDVLVSPFLSQLDRLSWHRGYSHSLVVCLALSLLLYFLSRRWKWLKPVNGFTIWMTWFLLFFTHVLLDSMTSYGTQLLLPFSDWRVSWDSINVVDPVYTVPLLIGLAMSWWLRNKGHMWQWPNYIGLLLSSIYLVFTLAHKEIIEERIYEQLNEQNIEYDQLLTVPVKVGNIIWYGVARNSDTLHLGKYNSVYDNKIEFHSFPINAHLLDKVDAHTRERLIWFSKEFFTVAQKDGVIRLYNMQCDMQGIREYGDYKAPTAFYFQLTPSEEGYDLSIGMHKKEEE
ncbi:MAG: metal-dependent hydrolase [Saprospiraceae bacterium]|nr:metal-dependent hydrolase [Saprospiraceae bacterium]